MSDDNIVPFRPRTQPGQQLGPANFRRPRRPVSPRVRENRVVVAGIATLLTASALLAQSIARTSPPNPGYTATVAGVEDAGKGARVFDINVTATRDLTDVVFAAQDPTTGDPLTPEQVALTVMPGDGYDVLEMYTGLASIENLKKGATAKLAMTVYENSANPRILGGNNPNPLPTLVNALNTFPGVLQGWNATMDYLFQHDAGKPPTTQGLG